MNNIPKNHSFSNLLIYYAIFLIFVNSGFYFAKIPYIAPIYLAIYVALPVLFIIFTIKNQFKVPFSAILGFIFIIYIILSQIIVEGKPIATIGSVVTILCYILGVITLRFINPNNVLKIINTVLAFSAMLYIIDTIHRLILANFNFTSLFINFYYIKKQCLYYSDTNPLAINTTILTFFSLYLYQMLKQKKYLFYIFLFTIITFMTMSRSAIISTILSLVIYFIISDLNYLRKNIYKFNYNISIKSLVSIIFLMSISITGIYILINIINYLTVDASFSTKIELIDTVHNFLLNSSPIQLLLGVGFNNGGISDFGELEYAHSYLATYVVETGLIGYTLMTIFLISIFIERKRTAYIFVPYMFMGISHISHAQLHLFYVILALIWHCEKFAYYKQRPLNIPNNYTKTI